MKQEIINKNDVNPVISYSISLAIHILIFAAIIFMLNIYSDRARINPQFINAEVDQTKQNSSSPQTNLEKDKQKAIENPGAANQKKDEVDSKSPSSGFQSMFGSVNADTTSLDQVYKEPTLNVSIKYPKGWVYVDQNVKNTLDGVTFWSTAGNFNPPPYIHLEVKDKSLFDQRRFKYKKESDNYTLYYNDPEELEGQVMQTIYIRTGTDEDFSVKLIMEGKEAFNAFQPVFFGMIKTFKFGRSFF